MTFRCTKNIFVRKNILKKDFFERPTCAVARDLIGKFIIRKRGAKEYSYVITEVEAYDGFHDKASHAHKGRTERNVVMFGHAGKFYVYLVYGMYYMLNIVTGEKNYPAAVLIRGARFCGIKSSSEKNRVAASAINGPGVLTKHMKLSKALNGKSANKKTGIWFEDRGVRISPRLIKRTPRIGVSYAGPVWANKKYRFIYEGDYINC